MGRIVAQGADLLVVTNDNPRGEEPRRITDAILEGIAEAGARERTRVIHDRALAIAAAVTAAVAGDVVLVAGKGHEDYQIVGTERRHFSDAEVARAVLHDWRAA
jgi:UDP-N-acetylmuramoyl-L-alanyl-D-glutamate--2,6-diaminopimelate ligase